MILAVCLSGCESPKSKPESATGVKKTDAVVKPQASGLTVEQDNIRRRLQMENVPGSLKHLYVISSMSGDVILYSTVKGKVTLEWQAPVAVPDQDRIGASRVQVERARVYLDQMAPEIAALFPDRFVDSELGAIPEGWEAATLDDIALLNPESWTARNAPEIAIRNVFSSGELEETATAKDFLAVQIEGKRRVRHTLKHYNLDAIVSVGYRVNSRRGVRFRQWATRTLREHLVRGFTLNERRLAERGLREARETLDLLARTLQSQAFVDTTGQAVLELITALTLLIAESAPTGKDLMIRLIINLLAEPAE